MRYYTKSLLASAIYLGGVSYVLMDTSEQYYSKKNQEIENLRANIYQAKVNKIIKRIINILIKVDELDISTNNKNTKYKLKEDETMIFKFLYNTYKEYFFIFFYKNLVWDMNNKKKDEEKL